MGKIELIIGGNSKRNKTGQHTVELDFTALPQNAQDFIVGYGLKQYLQDGTAGAETEADAKAGIDARLAKLKSGDLSRSRGEGLGKPDTVEGRANKLARQKIRDLLKEANASATKEQIAEAAQELVRSDEAFTKEAKKQLDAENASKTALSGSEALAGIMAKLKPQA